MIFYSYVSLPEGTVGGKHPMVWMARGSENIINYSELCHTFFSRLLSHK